jgi:hypothetical protein
LLKKDISFSWLSRLSRVSDLSHSATPIGKARQIRDALLEACAEALVRGFARFLTFLGAGTLDATAVGEPLLRQRICAACAGIHSR